MILPMIRAVDKMLELDEIKSDKKECARAVLAEIIQHLEKNPLGVPSGVVYDSPRTYIGDVDLDEEAKEAQKELMG
jgi:hypothetical protein